MKRSHMTRILAATLAAMMMLPMLAACAGDGDTTTDTTAAPAASHETTAAPAETEPPTHDENGFLLGRSQFEAPDSDGEIVFTGKGTPKPGEFVNVKITRADTYDLMGEMV